MTHAKGKYCSCRVKERSIINAQHCYACDKPISPNYGRPQTAAQKLAGQRNWDKAQLSGIKSRVTHYMGTAGNVTTAQRMHFIQLIADLNSNIDSKWILAKEKLRETNKR